MQNAIKWLATILFAPLLACGQNGDHAGETQKDVVPTNAIPPAPILSPDDQIRSFHLAKGFRAEVVAAEPLVQTPVAAEFDHQGRLWVVEMNGYMMDPIGTGEDRPTGDVVILEDTDGDGRMDRRTVFLDHLVMPRAIMLFQGGAVISEPPRLWFARDTNGDGKADEKWLITNDYATEDDPKLGAKASPEHASNGLMWGMDNWYYSANHTRRYRWFPGTFPTNWVQQPSNFCGQWGLSQDDEGRLFYNSNSDQLRADLAAGVELRRNPNLQKPAGMNYPVATDQRVWPARVNPGVNRGYQPGQLTPEGKLATYTAACGPLVYRGDQFPEAYRGTVFLCEPSANLIRCDFLSERDGVITAANAFPTNEFLASTDERFRPVTLLNGPDGALYVLDMARGLIQHKIFLTSYLRKQTESRHLEQPANLGRIYRITHQANSVKRKSRLPTIPETSALVAALSSPNGFWRDTAQRLLVERQDKASVPMIRRSASAKSNGFPLGRLQSLWTLEGLGGLDVAQVAALLDDPDPRVVAGAIHASESLLSGPKRDEIASLLLRRPDSLPEKARLQLLLTLGQIRRPEAEAAMRQILLAAPTSPVWFDCAVSGLAGRELEFLDALAGEALRSDGWAQRAGLYSTLGQCVVVEGKPERLARLLDLIPNQKVESWERTALLDGFIAGLPPLPKDKKSPSPRLVRVSAEPIELFAFAKTAPSNIVARTARIEGAVTWPGKPLPAGVAPAVELTTDEKASFERGKELYTTICGACHQPHGRGQEGLAPPLLNSEWALGSQQRLVRIVLHGLRDAVTVNGTKYSLNMPALGEALTDGQIADALTYIRREWGHTASAVPPKTVAAIRAAESKREDSWTEPELLKQP